MSRTYRARDVKLNALDRQAIDNYTRAGKPPKSPDRSPLERRLAALPPCKITSAITHARRRAAAQAAATAALQAYFIGVHIRAQMAQGDAPDPKRAKSRLMAETLVQLKVPRVTLRLPDASRTVAAKLHQFVTAAYREYLGDEPDDAFIDEQTALIIQWSRRGWAVMTASAHDYTPTVARRAALAGLVNAPEER